MWLSFYNALFGIAYTVRNGERKQVECEVLGHTDMSTDRFWSAYTTGATFETSIADLFVKAAAS